MGGVVIDSGTFDWMQNDKFPGLTAPNASYHGVVFAKACGNLAYIMKLRTTLMRDTGAALSPFHSFLLLQGLETLSLRVERHVENALKVVAFLEGSSDGGTCQSSFSFHRQGKGNDTTAIIPTAAARSLHLSCAVQGLRHRNSRNRFGCSRFWRMWRMSSRW